MKLDRDSMWSVLCVAGMLAFGAWVVANTEWADQVVRDPAKGEAAKDSHHAIKQIVRRLGGKVVAPDNLDRLPPVEATLVLSSWNWDLFPEREKVLRQWVESGGHLVTDLSKRPAWLAVQTNSAAKKRTQPDAVPQPTPQAQAPAADNENDDDDDDEPANTPVRKPGNASKPFDPPRRIDCFNVVEPESFAPAFEARRSFKLCSGATVLYLSSKLPVLWSLDGVNGPNVLRAKIGRGQSTVMIDQLSENRLVFEADHALAFIASLDLQRRPEVWFVESESRASLLRLIWRHGKPVVLLGVALLALALWRAAVRFGPSAPLAPLSRRSVAEQIRGTSSFIFQRDSSALHKAQLRQLEQTARRSIRDHDRMDRRSRAEAIARATALDADALVRAMDLTLKRPRRDLLATLTLLETAVRRLALNR
jgi:hypothetical protein